MTISKKYIEQDLRNTVYGKGQIILSGCPLSFIRVFMNNWPGTRHREKLFSKELELVESTGKRAEIELKEKSGNVEFSENLQTLDCLVQHILSLQM